MLAVGFLNFEKKAMNDLLKIQCRMMLFGPLPGTAVKNLTASL